MLADGVRLVLGVSLLTFMAGGWTGTRPSQAGQKPESVDCNQGGTTQYEMNVCAARAAEESTSKLQALLDELQVNLEPSERDELQGIQKVWEAYRERDCRWEGGFFEGGSVAPAVYAYCIKARTDERVDRLKILLCEGAGMTGPCKASEKY